MESQENLKTIIITGLIDLTTKQVVSASIENEEDCSQINPTKILKLEQEDTPKQTVDKICNPELAEHVTNGDISEVKNNKQEIFRFIEKHELCGVETMLIEGCDPNLESPIGFDCLYLAVHSKFLDAVKLLIEYGAEINKNTKMWSQRTPLGLACSIGVKEIIEYLVQKGADINGVDKDSYTPLHCACMGDSKPEIIKFLLNHGADYTIKTNEGNTALDLCKIWRNFELAKIIEHYANSKMAEHVTNGNISEVKKLLDANCNPNVPCGVYPNYLRWAICNDQPKMVKLLIEAGADATGVFGNWGHSSLHDACYLGSLKIVKYLVGLKYIDINSLTKWGDTCLHLIFFRYFDPIDPEMIRFLLENGADYSIKTSRGKNALDLAKKYGVSEAVEIIENHIKFQEQGTDLQNTTVPRVVVPTTINAKLFKYCRRGNEDKVKKLLDPSNGFTKLPSNKYSCVSRAIVGGYLNIVKMLINAGLNFEKKKIEPNKMSCFNYACFKYKEEIAKYLISLGADVNSISQQYKSTPLHVACMNHGGSAIIELLLENGADYTLENNSEETALDILKKRKSWENFEFLKKFIKSKGEKIITIKFTIGERKVVFEGRSDLAIKFYEEFSQNQID